MDAFSDRACEEIRREEPVALEGPTSHAILTTLLHKKAEIPSPSATTPLSLASIDSRDAPIGASGQRVPDIELPSIILSLASPDRPLAAIARVQHKELLLPDPTKNQLPRRIHVLSLHEVQSPGIQAREPSPGSPRSMPRFFFNPESPTSSNSSDGSSLFGSPRALSSGARSTSSDFYGCDSTSSSRDVSPFGSPSGGSYPLFRFAFPKDAQQPLNVLDPSVSAASSSLS